MCVALVCVEIVHAIVFGQFEFFAPCVQTMWSVNFQKRGGAAAIWPVSFAKMARTVIDLDGPGAWQDVNKVVVDLDEPDPQSGGKPAHCGEKKVIDLDEAVEADNGKDRADPKLPPKKFAILSSTRDR